MPAPAVSVVIPTFRRPRYLREAIASVVAQELGDWELLVCDDGGAPETRQVVAAFDDPRIVHRVNPTRLGIGANKFAGWRAARGRYVANLDDDDAWEPGFLSTLVPLLDADRTLVAAFGSHLIVDADGRVDAAATAANEARYRAGLAPGPHRELGRLVLLDQAIPLTMGAVIRREGVAWDHFPPQADVVADYWLGYLLVRTGGGAHYVPEPLTRYRVHAASATAAGGLAWHRSFAFCYRRLLEDETLRPLHPELRARLGAYERRTALSQLADGDGRAARRSCRRALAASPSPATVAVAALSLVGPLARPLLARRR